MSIIRRAKPAPAREPNAPRTPSRFGRWYRGRPLVGGTLIVIAGLEMILSGQLDLGSIHIQVGIEGMQAMILPIALATLGVLIVAMPVHRMFYGIMSLVISIYALVGVNLGGFLIGTVVGIVGGIMCVSWAPARPRMTESAAMPEGVSGDETSADSLELAGDSLTSPPVLPATLPATPGVAVATKGVAILALLVLVGVSAAGLAGTPSFADTPEPSPSASADPIPPVIPDPGPAPSATPDPLPAATPHEIASPVQKSPMPGSATLSVPVVSDPPVDANAPLAAPPTARLRSTSAVLEGARYLGTVRVAVAGGSVSTALKIVADRMAMGEFTLGSPDPATRVFATAASALTLDGSVVIYCTSLSGVLADGSSVAFDVSSPPPVGARLPSLTDVAIGLVSVSGTSASLTAMQGSAK